MDSQCWHRWRYAGSMNRVVCSKCRLQAYSSGQDEGWQIWKLAMARASIRIERARLDALLAEA